MNVIFSRDKDKRDKMFRDYRQTGNDLEKQVVKFSDIEPDINSATGEISLDNQHRIKYHNVWAIAYPSFRKEKTDDRTEHYAALPAFGLATGTADCPHCNTNPCCCGTGL